MGGSGGEGPAAGGTSDGQQGAFPSTTLPKPERQRAKRGWEGPREPSVRRRTCPPEHGAPWSSDQPRRWPHGTGFLPWVLAHRPQSRSPGPSPTAPQLPSPPGEPVPAPVGKRPGGRDPKRLQAAEGALSSPPHRRRTRAVPHPPPSRSPAPSVPGGAGPRPTDTHRAAGPLHGLPGGEAPRLSWYPWRGAPCWPPAPRAYGWPPARGGEAGRDM